MSVPRISLVLPCYNEQEVLPSSVERLLVKFNDMVNSKIIASDSKITFVDDGSKDTTWSIIKELSTKHSMIEGLKLSKNRGQQNAILAGYMELKDSFDALISLDVDLQDDISVLDQFITNYNDGCDVVFGARDKRDSDSFFKRHTALAFYNVMKMLGVDLVPNHSEYRLLTKRALNMLAQYTEVNLFLRAIVPTIGLKTAIVYYERDSRLAGESKYPLHKMINFAIEGITSFSIKPIVFVRNMGMIIVLISIVMAIYTFLAMIYHPYGLASGWSSLILSIWFVGGLNMFSLGMIGEYIGKIYNETKNRPRYFIWERTDVVESTKKASKKTL